MVTVIEMLGLGMVALYAAVASDLHEQIQSQPMLLPTYSAANPLGYNSPRPSQNYGAPHYVGALSDIFPPISAEEFRSHFMFGPDKISEVLRCLRVPEDPARVAQGLPGFPYRFDDNGFPTRWVAPETALLVFLKRLRTRGSVVLHLESFFGRSSGWISAVFNRFVEFLSERWIPLKIQSLDSRIFHYWRLKDYESCLYRAGIRLPGLIGFIDGTFHSIYRPQRDGYNGLLQRLFYSGAKKGHGLNFEMITFPDGLIGRAWGPVSGRHHDGYLGRRSGVMNLLRFGALAGFRLFGDKAYTGFGIYILHPFIAAVPGSLQARFNTYMSAFRIEVEHDIGGLYMQCGALQHETCLATQIPDVWFQAGVLMHNIHTCVYRSNQTALRFGCCVMSIWEYMMP